MLPRTRNGLGPFECISAMQKCIRRGLEREAMEFACELTHSSKGLNTMCCNRLEIICHEDINIITQPWILPFVATCCEQGRRWWKEDKPGRSRFPIGSAVRIMCRADKSREGDHFGGAIGVPNLNGKKPEIPDFAKDMHTHMGKKMGRGFDHFVDEGCKLVPEPEPDPYMEEWLEVVRANRERKAKKVKVPADQKDFPF